MSGKQIPRTDSIQELARFRDSHDLTDFTDQLEEVTEPVFQRQVVVKVPLPADDLKVLKKLAKVQAVRYTDLIRTSVLEKVRASWAAAPGGSKRSGRRPG